MAKPGKRDDDDNESVGVTAEVGSEGGTYADPVIQEATLERPLTGNERPEPTVRPPATVAGAMSPQPQGIDDGVHAPDEES
jgi:hypothetical protein